MSSESAAAPAGVTRATAKNADRMRDRRPPKPDRATADRRSPTADRARDRRPSTSDTPNDLGEADAELALDGAHSEARLGLVRAGGGYQPVDQRDLALLRAAARDCGELRGRPPDGETRGGCEGGRNRSKTGASS